MKNWKVFLIYIDFRRVSSIEKDPEIILQGGLSDTERLQGGPVPHCGQADAGVSETEDKRGEVSTGD